MAKKVRRVETKAKKKKWFSIVAPKIFLSQTIGETIADTPSDIIGKSVTVNLMGLTGDPKKQPVSVTFKVTSVEDDKAHTECTAYEISPASVRRLVRRNRERIDDSYVLTTSDGKSIRIKPLLLTRFNANKSVTKSLRKVMSQQMQKIVPNTSFETLLKDVTTKRFQMKIKDVLKKIYPVTVFEVRMIRVLGKAKLKIVTESKEEEKPDQDNGMVKTKPSKAVVQKAAVRTEVKPDAAGVAVKSDEAHLEKTVKTPRLPESENAKASN